MKTAFYRKTLAMYLIAAIVFCMQGMPTFSKPTTSNQAISVVKNWLFQNPAPMGMPFRHSTFNVTTYYDSHKLPAYYVVNLNPTGFVIVSGDDQVEPIIAFAPKGTYDPSVKNPLGAIVYRDLYRRVAIVRSRLKTNSANAAGNNQNKWAYLLKAGILRPTGTGIPSLSDVRVAPLVASQWNQDVSNNNYCYNYYTPNHDVCGCVATGMAQTMRHWQYPTVGIGKKSSTIYVDTVEQTATTRGGDGNGGAYNWSLMALTPDSQVLSDAQYQAIGALCYDAGVSVHMQYTSLESGAYSMDAASAYVNVFGYTNAIYYSDYDPNLPGYTIKNSDLISMINSNLDGGYPVNLGISGSAGGHFIVCDGYGYNTGTMYQHLNLGWAGTEDAWYNLASPNISSYQFDIIDECVYNIFPSNTGEIISGRVTDSSGTPLPSISVSAVKGATTYGPVTTNSKGIYAFVGVPSSSSYTISAQYNGVTKNITATTGTSVTGNHYLDNATIGNVWGANIIFPLPSTTTLISSANPSAYGQPVTFTATVTGHSNPSGTVQFAIDGTNVGSPATLSNSVATYTTSSLSIGTHSVTAVYSGDSNNNPSTSNTLSQEVKLIPVIASINPTAIRVATSGNITVNGSNFDSTCVVKWNGTSLTTNYVSDTKLTADVPASLNSALTSYPGSAAITVTNTYSETSNSVNIIITGSSAVITSVSPNAVPAASGFTLTVNGNNFLSDSQILWNGAAITTTYVSANQLTGIVTKSINPELSSYPGTCPVVVANPDGSLSNSVNVTINTPAPIISSLSPATTRAVIGFTLTVNGSKFDNTCTVKWNGTSLTTTYVSDTQLTAVVPASLNPALTSYPGSAAITVINTNGDSSNSMNITITEPAAVITSVSPSAVPAASGFTITVNGNYFLSGSQVQWNGTALTTTYVSANQLTGIVTKSINPELSSYPGTCPVVVANPDASLSNSVNVTINTPAPVIASLSPASTHAAIGFTLTVNGSHFDNTCTVKWNGTSLTTNYVSDTELTADVPVSLNPTLTSYPGSAAITVTNANGDTSNSVNISITVPKAVITSVTPDLVSASTGFTLSVNGYYFTSGAKIQWNGTTLTTYYASSHKLTATITKSINPALSSYPGTCPVIVVNGDGSLSNEYDVTINAPVIHTYGIGIQMISAPYDYSGQSISAICDNPNLTLIGWDASTLSYIRTPNTPADTFHAGKGYWSCITKTTCLRDCGLHANVSAPFTISLSTGWNLIGSPRDTSVSLSSITVTDKNGASYNMANAISKRLVYGMLYTFPAGSVDYTKVPAASGSLAPYAGYWIYAYQPCTLVLS